MSKIKYTNEDGNVVSSLLIVAVLVVIGVVGWAMYENHHNASHPTVASNTRSSTTKTGPAPTAPSSADPTAGWKKYCDTSTNDCLRYPSDWALTVDNSDGTGASFRSPDNAALVSYGSGYTAKQSGTDAFLAADVENTTTANAALKVVGGTEVPSKLPIYELVDASDLSAYPLTIGSSADFPVAAHFTNKNSSNGHLSVFPVGTVYTGTDQAQTWFGTADAKTGLLMLKSFTY